ncbi:MAG: YdeI/OmpD-associated family protein, partial [Paracoccaceae bacterium]
AQSPTLPQNPEAPMHPNPKVDFYFTKAKSWKSELETLRTIALSTPLTEDLKWGCPCYTLDGTNIVLIHAFKDYCALLFMKGALLPDSENILIQQTENVQSARQLRFTSAAQIAGMEATIKAYIAKAMEVEKSGEKVQLNKDLTLPDELITAFDNNPDLKAAFDALTPGRQRAYTLHFADAKQPKTRAARIEKSTQRILAGKGLDDK